MVNTRRAHIASRKVMFFALLTATLTAFLIRLCIAMRGGLWRDEGLFLSIVRMPTWGGMIDFLRWHESHPPLFYVMLRGWLAIAGDSERSALVLVTFLGALIVPAVYFVGRELFSSKAAVAASVLVVFSPILTEYSAAVRPYSFLTLGVLASSFLLVRALHEWRTSMWAAYAFTAVVLIYTHNWSWLVLGAQFFIALILIGRAKTRRRTLLFKGSVSAAFIIVLFAPWLSTLAYQAGNAGHAVLGLTGLSSHVQFIVFSLILVLQSTVLAVVGDDSRWILLLAILMSALAGLITTRRLHRTKGLTSPDALIIEPPSDRGKLATIVFLLIPAGAFLEAILLSHRSHLMMASCLSILAPLLILVLCDVLGRLWSAAVARFDKGIVAGAMMASSVLLGAYAAGLHTLAIGTRSNAREFASFVAQKADTTDLIVIMPEWLASSFNYYYEPLNDQIDYPNEARELAVDFNGIWKRIADSSSLERVSKRLGEARLQRRRVWLILEPHNLRPLNRREAKANTTGYGRFILGLRIAQIRATLTELYGEPFHIPSGVARKPRYEELVALLFSPK